MAEASGEGAGDGVAEASGDGDGVAEGVGVAEAAPRHRKLVVVPRAQGADCVHQAE